VIGEDVVETGILSSSDQGPGTNVRAYFFRVGGSQLSVVSHLEPTFRGRVNSPALPLCTIAKQETLFATIINPHSLQSSIYSSDFCTCAHLCRLRRESFPLDIRCGMCNIEPVQTSYRELTEIVIFPNRLPPASFDVQPSPARRTLAAGNIDISRRVPLRGKAVSVMSFLPAGECKEELLSFL